MNPEKLAPAAAIAVLVIFFVGGIVLLLRHKKKIRETWRAFAQAHGLTLSEGAYSNVTGQIDGRAFSMGVGAGRAAAGRPNVQRVVQFTITAEVKGVALAGLIGGKRGAFQAAGNVQTGDAQFDREIWVQCSDVEAAIAYLTPEHKKALREVAALGAVLLGPSQGESARLSRAQTGYKVNLKWLEAQRTAFLATAKDLDA